MRGTDFVVVADSNSVRAMVNGAIVVAPFSAQCSAAGNGPCSANAVELDSGSMQIIEFDSSLLAPRLIQRLLPSKRRKFYYHHLQWID